MPYRYPQRHTLGAVAGSPPGCRCHSYSHGTGRLRSGPQKQRILNAANQQVSDQESQPVTAGRQHDILIVGGGAGGQATAASLLKRQPDLDIAIAEPNTEHYYQPGWTLVGGGVFNRKDTVRPMADVMHPDCHWYQAAVSHFEPEQRQLVLEDGERLGYRILIIARD